MSEVFTHCFPHTTSLNASADEGSDDQHVDIFKFHKFTQEIQPGLHLTIEAARKLGHYLLIIMWRFVLKSPMLFRVRDEYVEQVKILEKFCFDRIEEFDRKVCYPNHLFEDTNVELFDDMTQVREGEENEEYEREEKRIKLDSESRKKVYSLSNYFNTIVSKYLIGELAKMGITTINDFLTNTNKKPLTIRYEELRNMVLKYFEYNPSIFPIEDQDINLYFVGVAALLEYFTSELIELEEIH